jgi:hypothetical protein
MLFKTPKTATAMALALGLSAPMPLFAQDASDTDLPECMEMVTLPCVTATGATVEGRDELDTYLSAFPEEAAAAAERGRRKDPSRRRLLPTPRPRHPRGRRATRLNRPRMRPRPRSPKQRPPRQRRLR